MYILIKIQKIQFQLNIMVNDVRNTIIKLEKLFKADKYTHKNFSSCYDIKSEIRSNAKYHKTKYPNAKFVKERFELAKNITILLKKEH